MRFHVTAARLGQGIGHLRSTLHSIDRAAMTAGRVFRATKHVMPDSKIKQKMEEGISGYEALRRKIKEGSD